MPLTKMEHFLVLTDDIDGTRDFYCEALGFTLGYRPNLAFAGYWLYLGATPCIHIGEWRSYTEHSAQQGIPVTRPAHSTGAVDHIAFNADDFDEMMARLKRHGTTAHVNHAPGGLRQLFLADPNGVKIEINIPPAPAHREA
jgi:catechol 2,3-dioxygenase-like lactoylglutathione lyase family enzyme